MKTPMVVYLSQYEHQLQHKLLQMYDFTPLYCDIGKAEVIPVQGIAISITKILTSGFTKPPLYFMLCIKSFKYLFKLVMYDLFKSCVQPILSDMNKIS